MLSHPRNNTLPGVYKWFLEQINPLFPQQEASSIAKVIFEDFYGLGAAEMILQRDKRFNESEIINLYRAVKKLQQNVPVQYITGKSYFRELILEVNPYVLIPRGETEELVEWIINDRLTGSQEPLHCWDIGTGSGAIALSLAKELQACKVLASDVSEKALEVARKNADNHKLDVQFLKQDMLLGKLPDQEFDVVVSNPPYVKDSEKKLMQANVLSHEPHSALFVPDLDPLVFYRAIAKAAAVVLKPGGALYAEINEALGKETGQLFADSGFTDILLKKDIHGRDRFVKGIRKG